MSWDERDTSPLFEYLERLATALEAIGKALQEPTAPAPPPSAAEKVLESSPRCQVCGCFPCLKTHPPF